MAQKVARRGHIPKVVGSNPASATKRDAEVPCRELKNQDNNMEREELLQQVNESIEGDGKQLSPSLSEESINGELDDALEDITDDAENNKKVIARLAKRLLRMDGNIHSNVSKQVSDYKKAHPKAQQKPKDGEGEGDDKSVIQKLLERVEAMEQAQKQKSEEAVKDAVVADVKKGFKAKFKEAGLEVNDYIFRQTLRDLEIPETGEGEKADIGNLVKTLEREYTKNLKEAGLGKENSSKPRFGSRDGGKGESAADRFFAKKAKKEGWKK